MKINYSKIVTKEELLDLGLDKLQFAKNIATNIKEKYDYDIHMRTSHNSAQTTYRNSHSFSTIANETIRKKEFDNVDDKTKLVLKSNIMFPDYKKLFDILLSNKVSFKILLIVSNRISTLKLLSQISEQLEQINIKDKNVRDIIKDIFNKLYSKEIIQSLPSTNDLGKQLHILHLIVETSSRETTADKNLNFICKKLQYYYSADEYEVIVTRLNQIVAFEKDLYKSFEEKNKQKIL